MDRGDGKGNLYTHFFTRTSMGLLLGIIALRLVFAKMLPDMVTFVLACTAVGLLAIAQICKDRRL